MFKIKLFFLLLISFTWIELLQVQAQSIPDNLHSPVKTHIDLGFMAILGGGMEYRLNGEKIDHYRDFKKLIYSLHDAETSKLIREAESTDLISWIVLASGIAAATDIALVYKPDVIFNSEGIDRIVTGLLTAQIGLGLYAIVHNIAEARKYNAVQRYNHLIEKASEESSFELNPKLYACSNGLVLGGELTF